MVSIVWTEEALSDIDNIAVYISKDSSFYAKQFVQKLFDAVLKLERYPDIGKPLHELPPICLQRNSLQKIPDYLSLR